MDPQTAIESFLEGIEQAIDNAESIMGWIKDLCFKTKVNIRWLEDEDENENIEAKVCSVSLEIIELNIDGETIYLSPYHDSLHGLIWKNEETESTYKIESV